MLSYSVAAMIVGQSCLFTILPPIGRQVGLAEYQIGLIMSVHGLFMLFTGPIAGAMSEKIGRRRILVGGTALYAVSIVAFGVIIDAALRGLIAAGAMVVALVMSRAVFAMGAGAVLPGSMALAADLTSRENRMKAMSLLATSVSAGAIIGPSFAALSTGIGPSAPFYIIGAFAFAGAVAARFILPEPRVVAGRSATGGGALWFARPGLIALANAMYLVGCYGIFSILGFLFQDRFELSTTDASRVMGLGLMTSAAMNVVTQTFVVRRLTVDPWIMLAVGIPITVIGFLVIDFGTSVAVVILGMLINAVGQGVAGSAFSTALSLSAGPSAQGRVAGLSTSAQAIAFLFGPAGAATIYQFSPPSIFVVACVSAGAAMCAVPLVRRPAPQFNG